MNSFILFISAALFCVSFASSSQTYSKSLYITGAGFYDEFLFYNSADPTHGRVEYVDKQTAQQYNLTHATDQSFILRADHTTYLMPSDPGRKSVRLSSKKQFSTFVAIFDIRHMPEGCGTWPAVWTVGDNWPHQGEIDILEGVNNMGANLATLHTGSNCKMPSQRYMTGRSNGDNCAAYETGNQGCGVKFSHPASFGPIFNANKGGWYAVERTNHEINVYFWDRNSNSVPVQVEQAHDAVEPEIWGQPVATWPDGLCNFKDHFGPHSIVINLTFCGDWAGATYQFSGCPDTCENYVNTNPDSFYNAYFDFAAIRIYT